MVKLHQHLFNLKKHKLKRAKHCAWTNRHTEDHNSKKAWTF